MRSGYYKVDYWKDRQLFPYFVDKLVVIAVALIIVLAPLIFDEYMIHMLNLSAIAVIGALGLNILMGYTGQISLGHAGFMAIGAYTTAILGSLVPGMPSLLLVVISGIVTSVVGSIAAIPAFRLKGLYLALSTLGLYYILMLIIVKARTVTNGAIGLEIPKFDLFGLKIADSVQFYPILVIMALLSLKVAKNLLRTKTGRAWMAIRDRDLAAEAVGVNLRQGKIHSFITSSFYVGVSGSLLAYYTGFITPENFTLTVTINYVAMVIIGGMGTLAGVVAGAVLVTFLPVLIQFFTQTLHSFLPFFEVASTLPYLERVCFGLAIVVVLIYEPDGLFGIWKTFKNYLVNWPFKY